MDTGSLLYLRNHSYCVWHNYRPFLLQDIRCHSAPRKADERSATISTEWRHGECCKAEKNSSCYILCVFGVFSLLFTKILYWCCKNAWWNSLVITIIWVQLYLCVSEFISQSADLLLEDEKYSSNCQEHTTKHLSLWYLNTSYISEQFCFFSEENKTLINGNKVFKNMTY